MLQAFFGCPFAVRVEVRIVRGFAPNPLIASLFERFGVTGLLVKRVEAELEKMLGNRTLIRS